MPKKYPHAITVSKNKWSFFTGPLGHVPTNSWCLGRVAGGQAASVWVARGEGRVLQGERRLHSLAGRDPGVRAVLGRAGQAQGHTAERGPAQDQLWAVAHGGPAFRAKQVTNQGVREPRGSWGWYAFICLLLYKVAKTSKDGLNLLRFVFKNYISKTFGKIFLLWVLYRASSKMKKAQWGFSFTKSKIHFFIGYWYRGEVEKIGF